MNKINILVVSLIIVPLFVACDSFFNNFAAGSNCNALHYEFALDGTALVNKIQEVKKKYPQWDVFEKKDSVYCAVDSNEVISVGSYHINHYSMRIFNKLDTCVIFCDINLGSEDSPSDVKFNQISIISYYFPEISDSSSDCTFSDGTGELFWKHKNPVRVHYNDSTELQKRAQRSAEAFFKLIGPYKHVSLMY